MQHTSLFATAILALSMILTPALAVGRGANLFCLGVGASKNGPPPKSSPAPFAPKVLRHSPKTNTVWGFEIMREGTVVTSPYGKNQTVKAATSYTILRRQNLYYGLNYKTDLFARAGARLRSAEEPACFTGSHCYANTKPHNRPAANVFGLLNLTLQNINGTTGWKTPRITRNPNECRP